MLLAQGLLSESTLHDSGICRFTDYGTGAGQLCQTPRRHLKVPRMTTQNPTEAAVILSERQISYDITYTWHLKHDTDEFIYETEIDLQRE